MTENDKKLATLFSELVPHIGKADSLAGEITRAAGRIGYRWANDGDQIGIGYGKETCNPAARFLLIHGSKDSQVGDMYSDQVYMQIISDFAAVIIQSADDRNNASHGGSLIDIVQCKSDKKTIINDLEEIRRTSIGLIQQLLFLLFSHE